MLELRGKFSEERLIAIGFLIALALVLAVSLLWVRFSAMADSSLRWVSHTYDVIARIQTVMATVTSAESGVRGFVITGRDNFLEPYRQATEQLNSALDAVQDATQDNPRQQSSMRQLRSVIAEKSLHSERLIALRRGVGFAAARSDLVGGEGSQLMDRIRAIIAAMHAEERALLDQRLAAVESSRAHVTASVAGIALTMLLLLTFLAYAIRFAMRARGATVLQLEQIAHHDPLTGLANRRHLEAVLRRTMELVRRKQRQAAVIFMDLDGFKQINDELGHKAGDALLIEVSRRLKSNVRLSDVVARLGGDEFVVVLPEIETIAEIERVAQKLIEALSHSYQIGGQSRILTASAGIARFPGDAATLDNLLANADRALYEAKAAGKNRYAIFRHRFDLETKTRSA